MDAISKIHEFLRFGTVLGLERMNALLSKLDNPQEDLKVIHVAGTNGKGSVCRYIYEALREAGYRTGLYTSPYLEVFNERIEMDGAYISDEDLEQLTNRVLEKVEEMTAEGLESPTEFEVVTAIAFLYFSEKKADYVVLEVGLGGRGDSTNVVKKPLASVITSISLDHTDRLGNTIGEIAAEKAGIIKEGCLTITSAEQDEALEVLQQKADQMGAALYDSRELPCRIKEETEEGSCFTSEIFGDTYEIEITMLGAHQVQNALTALETLVLLRRKGLLKISNEAIKAGFRKARQIGRLEILSKEPLVLIDGAHNPDGAKALKQTVDRLFIGRKILMTTGVLADKDVDGILDSFMAITGDFVATEPDNPRKMSAENLANKIAERGGKCCVCKTPQQAVEWVKAHAKDYDLFLFAGSLYLIGKIRRLLSE